MTSRLSGDIHKNPLTTSEIPGTVLNSRATMVNKRNTVLLTSCLESKGEDKYVYNRMWLAIGVNKDMKL